MSTHRLELLLAGPEPQRRAARLEALLAAQGEVVHFTAKSDAADALQALQAGAVDAMVMDSDLADSETVAAITRLRQLGCSTPIVFLGERNGFADAKALIDKGGDACLIGDGLVEERLALTICGYLRRDGAAREGVPGGDPAAGLLARPSFVKALERAVPQARAAGRPVALLMLDIQDFRSINQMFGYRFADAVLAAAGDRVRRAVRKEDVVGHLGADQFGVLLAPGASLKAGVGAARKLVEAFAEPIHVAGQPVRLHVVVGVAARPEHGDTADSLLIGVDAAAAEAKKSPSSVAAFPGGPTADPAEAHALAIDLRQAAERNEYFLSYQPKIEIRSGQPVGAEALIRWRHPSRGLMPPDLFIPLAERTGLIDDLTFWALRSVLSDLAAWSVHGIQPLVAVNLSAVSLRGWRIVEGMQALLARCPIPAGAVTLEITESILIRDIDRARAVLAALKGLGFKIAIDDFGAGYSSIGYLRRLPLDEIKIDRSLVRTMLESPRDRAIVKSTIDLGRLLGLDVVAEGVEDAATLALLADLGCPYAQGYHISRPIDADALRDWWVMTTMPRSRALARG
ncbi:putative bifunctional diguanylate cyclase/phosphodiesterase [Desertibaculum subflavum]|uniref:putative bifunctional diguanylate cyclase/phosphodiesterase n=1 Tax=Desertibaculum subflavum TaxID=2268458 RepID=UPI0013C5181A